MDVCKKKGNMNGNVLGENYFSYLEYVTKVKGFELEPALASVTDHHTIVEHAIAFMEHIDGRSAGPHFNSELRELHYAVMCRYECEILEELCDVIVTSLRASRERGLDIGFTDVLQMLYIKLHARRPGYTSDVNADVDRVLRETTAALESSNESTHEKNKEFK